MYVQGTVGMSDNVDDISHYRSMMGCVNRDMR